MTVQVERDIVNRTHRLGIIVRLPDEWVQQLLGFQRVVFENRLNILERDDLPIATKIAYLLDAINLVERKAADPDEVTKPDPRMQPRMIDLSPQSSEEGTTDA